MKRWPLHKAYFWETAPFFRLLLPFAAGIFWYDRIWANPIMAGNAWFTALIALLLYIIINYLKRSNIFLNVSMFFLWHIALFFGGYGMAIINDIRSDHNWHGRQPLHHRFCQVVITDDPAEKEHTWKIPVSVLKQIDSAKVVTTSGKALLYIYKDSVKLTWHKGDTILVPGDWTTIKSAGNPYEFDYAAYCRRNNIYYQQFCSLNDTRLYAAHNPQSTPLIEKIHQWCMLQLDRYLPDRKTKGLVQAMLLGDEVNLDEGLLHSYSETGIVHIIAISGGNVVIFFSLISFLLGWLKHKRHLWMKYVIALPLVWFYVLIAGAPPSAIRAAVMFSLLAGGIMFQKGSNSLNHLFATAFLLLAAQPMWLFSAGFQLSFIAVLSLIIFYSPIYKWLSPSGKIAKGIWSTIVASLSAEILVAPLVVYYFHIFPLLFLFANVVAYIFMGVVLNLSMAIICLSFVPVLAKFTGVITVWLVTWFDKIVEFLQNCNPVSFRFLALTGLELTIIYVLIAALAVFFMKKQKYGLYTSLISGVLLLLLLCSDQWTASHQHKLVVFNTGKSNHIELIEGKKFTILYQDTGSQKKIDYAVKPAHIMWHAWQQDSATGKREIITINGKRILILNQAIDTSVHFHADYLIINYTGNLDAAALKSTFSPLCLVIGNNYTRRQQDRLKQKFSSANIPVHFIGSDGAFIVE